MTKYQELIAQLAEAEERLDFLKMAHMEHVEHFLGSVNQEMNHFGMSLDRVKKDASPASGVIELTIYDDQAELISYEIDSFNQVQFAAFKPHIKNSLTPVVATKWRVMSLMEKLPHKNRAGVQKI